MRGGATVLPLDEQLGLVDLNIRALTELTLRFLPAMVARVRGGVINLGSVASFTRVRTWRSTMPAKVSSAPFRKRCIRNCGRTGVTVTCVATRAGRDEFLATSGANRVALFKILPSSNRAMSLKRAGAATKQAARLVIPALRPSYDPVGALVPSAIMLPLIGRLQRRSKDPCPCGSGKSFTSCCGARSNSLESPRRVDSEVFAEWRAIMKHRQPLRSLNKQIKWRPYVLVNQATSSKSPFYSVLLWH